MTKAYSRAYREMSKWAHPTAISCARLIQPTEWGPELHLETACDQAEYWACAAEVAVTAIFACLALRNAAVHESAIPPDWRQRLTELARQILDSDMPHLERDWDQEQRDYDELQNKIQSIDDLQRNLHANPRSWDNLHRTSGVNDADTP